MGYVSDYYKNKSSQRDSSNDNVTISSKNKVAKPPTYQPKKLIRVDSKEFFKSKINFATPIDALVKSSRIPESLTDDTLSNGSINQGNQVRQSQNRPSD